MGTLLFIISAILFQLPFATYQDTIRRLKRMESIDPLKAFNYSIENGRLTDNKVISLLVFISGFVFSVISLFKGINLHWLIIVIGNIMCLYFVTPFIAYRLYPIGMVYNKRMLLIKTTLYIILGVIFYFVANSFK